MTRAKAAGRRGLWRTIHLWIGVSLLLLLAPLGLSGSLLVWDVGLDKLIHPARYAVHAGEQAPDAYLAAARQAFAGRVVAAQIRLPESADLPVAVVGYAPGKAAPGQQRPPSMTAWLDPATARVLDVGDPRKDLRGIIHRLHGNMLLTQNGRPVVGWLGLAMLVMSLTGLVVWWPRNNNFAMGLRWTRSGSVFGNLHHMMGFWISLPLAILSATGAYIAFRQTMHALTAPLQPASQDRRAGERPGFAATLPSPALTADLALTAARAADPSLTGARLVSINLPTEGGRKPAWRFQFRASGPAPVTVRVTDVDGKARLQDGPATDGPGGGDPIAKTMRELHDGGHYGLAWRIIIALAGLAPTILGLTGIVVWLSRRRIAASGKN
jgi:uncharacterized iron-regulated membrane protein